MNIIEMFEFVKKGEIKYYEDIIEYFEQFINYLDKKCYYHDIKNDLIIELMELVWVIPLKFNSDNELIAYVNRCLLNKWIRTYKGLNKITEKEACFIESTSGVDKERDFIEERIILEQFIEQLTEKQRFTIKQFYFEGKCVREIAKELRVSRQAANDLKLKGLRNLRAMMGDKCIYITS